MAPRNLFCVTLGLLLPGATPALVRAPQSMRHDNELAAMLGASSRMPRVSCAIHAGLDREQRRAADDDTAADAPPSVYFIMGGPGSGKGTQCERLVERFGLVHLSAGELLREEVRSGSELGLEISKVINQGQIVKSDTTVRLLTNAMAGRAGPFLIDGFPRSISNLEAFESAVGSPAFMLFLDVSEAEMEARLLNRGLSSGRSDDNAETIKRRFRTFVQDSLPVVESLEARGCLRRIDAGASVETVFERVCAAFDDQGLAEVGKGASHAATRMSVLVSAPAPKGFEWGASY
jgi:UMP-CMP kinase